MAVSRFATVEYRSSSHPDLFLHPLADQVSIADPVSLSHLSQGFRFFEGEMHCYRLLALKNRVANFLKLILEISQIMRIPEIGQLVAGVCLRNLLITHRFCHS
jgi:hypothetical protein